MRTRVRSSTPSSSPNASTRWSRRRDVRACVAPSERLTPSGTSTIPSAVISVGRPSATPAPMRTRSRAVRGFASGRRMRYGAAPRGAPSALHRVGSRSPPASDEVRLELLELPRLVVDDPLRLVGRQFTRLADEARGPPEVERRERRPAAARDRRPAGCTRRGVVEASDPELGAEVELGRVGADLEVIDPLRAAPARASRSTPPAGPAAPARGCRPAWRG